MERSNCFKTFVSKGGKVTESEIYIFAYWLKIILLNCESDVIEN